MIEPANASNNLKGNKRRYSIVNYIILKPTVMRGVLLLYSEKKLF
jgi:hypothetical protein